MRNITWFWLWCAALVAIDAKLQRRTSSTEAGDNAVNHIEAQRDGDDSARSRFERMYQERLAARRRDFEEETIMGKEWRRQHHRSARSVINSPPKVPLRSTEWGHTEWFGEDQIALQWKTKEEDKIVFRVEARADEWTPPHVALAFGDDAVVVYMDNQFDTKIVDCHLVDGIPVPDESNDYELAFGLQNQTHIVTEFTRAIDTCDPDDVIISSDPIGVKWTLGHDNPLTGLWKGWKGVRTLRILNPKAPSPSASKSEFKRWDVTIKNLEIPEYLPTMFWVKIFKVPQLHTKHHIVGYRPVGEFSTGGHVVLYECAVEAGAEGGQWDHWAMGNGTQILSMPREWALCLSPVATWAIGSKGEMFPEHVGIPLGGSSGVTYYMLEIHYENSMLRKVNDDFGLTILYTDELRAHDAGVMVSGITVSALHILPADQPVYKSAGYCSEPCTEAMFPPDGINIVSVLLHAHNAKRKLSLRHVRNGEELPKVAEDEYHDEQHPAKNTQSRVLLEERNVLPGDALITECVYNTLGRKRPTFGGYSSKQEMCLAFILHYPRIPLTGCYSMTPVKEFFDTFGVKEFYAIDMKDVENMFLSPSSLEMFTSEFDRNRPSEVATQGDDQGVSVLGQLVIKTPYEFKNKTFIAHLNELPWNEPLLTKRIEDTLYKGKHMTFCRKRDETYAIPAEIRIFPNFSEVTPSGSTIECLHKLHQKNSTSASSPTRSHGVHNAFSITAVMTLLTYIICLRRF